MMDEFINALDQSHSDDLPVIRNYIKWVSFRRKITNTFYQKFHWVKPTPRIHWIGR